MSPYQNFALYNKLSFWSKCLSIALIIIGCLVLLGWQFEIDILKRPVPRLVAMNPLTALSFALSGTSLLLGINSRKKNEYSVFALVISIIVLLAGLSKVVSILTGYDLHIDTLLFHSSLEQDVIANTPNRMAPNSAFNFVLAGITLIILNYKNTKALILAQLFALIILLLGLLSILGYLYKVNSFYGFASYMPMSVHAAISFLLFSLAVLFLNPDQGIMRNFTSTYTGSTSARFLVPAAILIPAFLGYLRLLGDWSGLYSKEFGVALLVLSIIIVFLILIWNHAASLNKKDALKKIAEEDLKQLNAELEQKVKDRTEEVIRNESRYRSMIENASDIISMIDEHNAIHYINPAIENISGYSIEEIRALDRSALQHPDDREKARTNFNFALKNPDRAIPVQVRIIHKSGKVIWLEGIIKNLLHDNSINAIVSTYRDVTERKEAEEKALASERKIWHTLDKMMEGIQIIGSDWKYIYVNEAVARQGKYSREELIGYTMMEKYPGIENSKLFEVLKKCMNEGVSELLENEFEHNDGSKGWFELSIQPVPEGIFILSLDITNRKAAELAIHKLNEELEDRVTERTAQLEAVNKELEAFSYSVSHDLRAPLRAVNGYARMIEEDYRAVLDDEGKRLLGIVQYNAQRMGILIDDLLSFSRLGRKEIQKSTIDVKELIEANLSELDKMIPHKAEIRIKQLINLEADYALINQVFLNLISNAIKYSAKKEKPVIEISSEIKGQEVVYCIRDNGAGFDMKYGHKLFGVFQRLHGSDEFEGTGVGLAIVQRIINKHGGKVWAEGKVNEGAAFYFSLPLSR